MRVHDHDVPGAQWREHCAALAGEAAMLDLLTAVDDPGAGWIEVVAHLVDVDAGERHLLVTRVPRAEPVLDSLTGLFPGAGWHERVVHEMFGVRFSGNDDQRPLLTDGSGQHPLRRTSALPARVGTPWPGAVEPSDRPADGGRAAQRPRTRPGPPGVPAEWSAPPSPGPAP